jgi:hypothetical protein
MTLILSLIRYVILMSVADLPLMSLAVAQALPPPLSGVPYFIARQKLILAGWKPSIANKIEEDELQKELQEWYISNNFYEIEQCLPTGVGACVSYFRNRNGQTIRIVSSGGSKDNGAFEGEGPIVLEWSVCNSSTAESCAK